MFLIEIRVLSLIYYCPLSPSHDTPITNIIASFYLHVYMYVCTHKYI